MTAKIIRLRFTPHVATAEQARRHPAMLAAHIERWRQGCERGRQEGRSLVPAGRHRSGAGELGRAEQPPGRHTPEYRATVTPTRGMYPLGGARRVTAETDTGMDDDRGHSDANQRFKINSDGEITR